ncbi:MAG: cupin domain-containing protein [Bacteroidetes bacterium]|nr:cupin domain-containing protein [Bacteroidota bacterium]MBL6964183.1 cupin domain-containing protein [Bacteroidota bacterium]
MKEDNFYPELIKNLPEADIPFKGIRGWISQAEDHQVVYMDIQPIGEVRAHNHGEQWGYVFEGDMDLTIGDVTKTYKKGDSYFIPEGVMHSAIFKKRTLVMDFFGEKERYQVKK